MKAAGERLVITPDYCRGILEAEALFRVFVSTFAAALVTTLGLSAGVLVLGIRLPVGGSELGYCKHVARFLAGGGVHEEVLDSL